MTENQERAYAELSKVQEYKSQIRILELKYEATLDEAGLGSAWPKTEVVPGKKAKHPVKDGYTKEIDQNLYAFLERGTSQNIQSEKLAKVIDKRLAIEQEIELIEEEMKAIEVKIKQRCDCLEAEVLIRKFVFEQKFSDMEVEMKQTKHYINQFYYDGLEKYGAF